jgi:hypothetical protein
MDSKWQCSCAIVYRADSIAQLLQVAILPGSGQADLLIAHTQIEALRGLLVVELDMQACTAANECDQQKGVQTTCWWHTSSGVEVLHTSEPGLRLSAPQGACWYGGGGGGGGGPCCCCCTGQP